jgi:energy-coupling factor transporter transmembrane protein EcfT
VVACKPEAVTKLKKKYLWSWAIAGVMIPLLLLLVGLFMPKPPEWNPFQEPKVTPAQHRLAVVATLLWPTELVAEVLALVVTDAGGNSGAPIPSAIIIAISLALNAAIYVGIGLILWTFGEVFSCFFQRRSPD